MNDMTALTGRLWNEAREILSAYGFVEEAIQVRDITPERAPKTPSQTFGWGEERVVRVVVDGAGVRVTIAREMKA